MIITLPSDSHIHHISSTFLSHVHIPSNITNSLQTSTKQLLHILISYKIFWNFEVCYKSKTKEKKKKARKKEGEKERKKRDRKSEKKENKLEEYLLFSTPPSLPFPSIPIIHHHPHHLGAKIIISGTIFAF